MHPELQEAIDFHEAIIAEGSKALVGYDTEKALANIVVLSEIPTTYDKDDKRQVNSGNLLLRGVPGVGKTFFGVILAAISGAKFARIQGRADLQPTEVVGFQMINPATGAFITEFIFRIPAMGQLGIEAIFARDYPVIMALVLVIAVGFAMSNLIVDVGYTLIDPRIRYR